MSAPCEPVAGARHPGRVGWGLPDVVFCWLAGGFAAGLVGVSLSDRVAGEAGSLYLFGVILPAQQLAVILAMVFISRVKGQGSLAADFGLRIRLTDARAVLAGGVLEIALAFAVIPLLSLDGEAKPQQLLRDLEHSQNPVTVALFVIGAVIAAPVVEELLFRGMLLRALLRRFEPATAVLGSAVSFALVHYIGDPNTLLYLPALTALGVVLGVVVMRTNNLSRAIFIHAGFNLTTTVIFLVAGSGSS